MLWLHVKVSVSSKPGAEPLMGGFVAYGEEQSEVQPLSHQSVPESCWDDAAQPGAEGRAESFPQGWELHFGSSAGSSIQAGRQGQVSSSAGKVNSEFK